MEHKEEAVKAVSKAVSKAGAWPTRFKGRVGHGNEKVGEKRRFHEACDTGRGEAARQQQQGKCRGGAGAGGGALTIKRTKGPHNRISDCKQWRTQVRHLQPRHRLRLSTWRCVSQAKLREP